MGSRNPQPETTESPLDDSKTGNIEPPASSGHDIIVIGASLGGIAAMCRLVAALPEKFPAAIFVVIHMPAYSASQLPALLTRNGKLPAVHPIHGQSVRPGHIYVAPPDNHLILHGDVIRLERGPTENGHRPAIDVLFRTAARTWGARTIGIILTGSMDYGVGGMLAIKAAGGITIAQDPAEAECGEMPRHAIDRVEVDYIARLDGIAALLIKLVHEPITEDQTCPVFDLDAEQAQSTKPCEVVCPHCNGVMTESQAGGVLQFSCHVGHVFSINSLIHHQAESLESALWAAVRALQESEDLARRMILRSPANLAERFAEKANAMRQLAQTIQHILLSRETLTRPDAALQSESTPYHDVSSESRSQK